jgi:hypothetical protein
VLFESGPPKIENSSNTTKTFGGKEFVANKAEWYELANLLAESHNNSKRNGDGSKNSSTVICKRTRPTTTLFTPCNSPKLQIMRGTGSHMKKNLGLGHYSIL